MCKSVTIQTSTPTVLDQRYAPCLSTDQHTGFGGGDSGSSEIQGAATPGRWEEGSAEGM